MKTSKKGIDLIKEFEGFSAGPYSCPAGIPTIGYGSTFYPDGKRVTMDDAPISEEEAEKMLSKVIQVFEDIVNKKLTVPVNQNQFDALVSHTYNTGGSSNLFALVNKGKMEEAEDFIRTRYITVKGQRMKGLIKRRSAEADLFLSEI
ncbi:MAG: lysozyme [Bacteroidia bacterium]|nr:lysozyme [Bacteroidia bacterium]